MSGHENGAVDEGPVPVGWTAGERFQIATRGDRYDGTHGTIRRVFTSLDGREHAHVKHDDGTITTWPTARLERETLPPTSRRAIADTLAYAAQHLEQGDPACDCALHMAVAARAVVTDRAVRGVSSQAGLQALAVHSTPGGAVKDRAPAPPAGTTSRQYAATKYAARRLAEAAAAALEVIVGGGIGPGHPRTHALAEALADFQEVTR